MCTYCCVSLSFFFFVGCIASYPTCEIRYQGPWDTAHVPVSRLQCTRKRHAHDYDLAFAGEVPSIFNELGQKIQVLAEDQAILVYCAQGKRRSTFVAAGMLMGASNKSPSEVDVYLNSLRNVIDLRQHKDHAHKSALEALADYEQMFHAWASAFGLEGPLMEVMAPDTFKNGSLLNCGHSSAILAYIRTQVVNVVGWRGRGKL